MKRIILLGSTGSIGRNNIKVVENLPDYKIVGIAAYKNYRLLKRQADFIKPKALTIIDEDYYKPLKKSLGRMRLFAGWNGLVELIEGLDAEIIVFCLNGSMGIYALMKAIEKRMRICLATKEILVSFGEIVMKKIKENNIKLLPVDSEHSAIYQCLEERDIADVSRIILTASGGPFLNRPIKNVTKLDVLSHPVWNMGAKITVDSASMMNKSLEVIEAHHLFGIPPERIEVVIHPEAICHSFVQFIDGVIIGQLSLPDMKLPIQYALTAPKRLSSLTEFISLGKLKQLNFSSPDFKKFPCLGFGYEALRQGGSMPAVLNGVDQEVVKLFLEERIKFSQIPKIIYKVMHHHYPKKGNINDYIEAEDWARDYTRNLVC